MSRIWLNLPKLVPAAQQPNISPIGGVQNGEDFHVFYSETEVGPVTQKLYDELTGIQFGDIQAPEGWIVPVD